MTDQPTTQPPKLATGGIVPNYAGETAGFRLPTADQLRGRIAELEDDLGDARRELAEYRQLFELQWTRSREADARWRAEDPETRAHIQPDLGTLLTWLMADADQAKAARDKTTRERDSLARRCAVRFEQTQAYKLALAELTEASRRLITTLDAIELGHDPGLIETIRNVRDAITRAGQTHLAAEIIRLDEEWTPKLQAFADKILSEKARTGGGSVARVAQEDEPRC